MNVMDMIMRDAMRGAHHSHQEEMHNQPLPIVEAQIATLQEIADIYRRGCPFKVGDVITPRNGHNMKGAGRPHVVMEVFDEPVRTLTSADPADTSQCTFGRRMDMRVATFSVEMGVVVAFMTESWEFESFKE
jgi:hypothetical protein